MADLPDDLQQKLEDYNKNFEKINEFFGDESLMDAGAITELRNKSSKEMLSVAMPIAVKGMVELATCAISESVRLKAQMYIIDRNLGRDIAVEVEDETTKLLKRIQVKKED